jgi:signal peptidase II
MVVYFARSGARHPALPVAFGFLLGGAMSNLVDRLRQGYVTDFLDPDYWPAFNLGDVFITIGVIILIAVFLVGERWPRQRRHARPTT